MAVPTLISMFILMYNTGVLLNNNTFVMERGMTFNETISQVLIPQDGFLKNMHMKLSTSPYVNVDFVIRINKIDTNMKVSCNGDQILDFNNNIINVKKWDMLSIQFVTYPTLPGINTIASITLIYSQNIEDLINEYKNKTNNQI